MKKPLIKMKKNKIKKKGDKYIKKLDIEILNLIKKGYCTITKISKKRKRCVSTISEKIESLELRGLIIKNKKGIKLSEKGNMFFINLKEKERLLKEKENLNKKYNKILEKLKW